MNARVSYLTVASLVAAATLAAQTTTERPAAGPVPPPWAFTVNSPAPQAPPPSAMTAPAAEDHAPRRVPGSTVALTPAQLRDLFNPPDWHPEDHPAPPEVVAHGRKPDVRACGYCHYPNGQGRPENSSLAGLPRDYTVQQMADLRSGARRSSEPRMRPPAFMAEIARASTTDEDRAAAEYFAGLTYKPWITVKEVEAVPRSRIAGGMHVPAGEGTEPIGLRIIEMPVDPGRTELRDSASGFVAYVPTGSVARGEALVRGASDRTRACGTCHGDDLRGLGPVPPLAGRSPSYTVRQLYDFQSGARKGPWSPLMRASVSRLTLEDLVAIAAYTASREP